MDEDSREEQESRSIQIGVLEAVLRYRKKRSEDILKSLQDTQKAFTMIRTEGRALRSGLDRWLKEDSKAGLDIDLQIELEMYGNPSEWPVDARTTLQHRLAQILEEFHFNHSAKHIEAVMRNSGL